MRLCKGAGVSELLGLQMQSPRKNYTLIRPLLTYSKKELLDYLHENDYPYFTDESNTDEKYERNKFRNQFSDSLMSQCTEGIKRSFDYLRHDKNILESGFETLCIHQSLHVIKLDNKHSKVKAADLALKKLGYLLSAPQRKEIEKESSLVIGGKWAIELQDDLLYIAPSINMEMPKKFKEKCRIERIPVKIRPYIFKEDINLESLIFDS